VLGEEIEDTGDAHARTVGLVRHGREVLCVVITLGEDGSLGVHVEGELCDGGSTPEPVS
jgi:hypothetical protein